MWLCQGRGDAKVRPCILWGAGWPPHSLMLGCAGAAGTGSAAPLPGASLVLWKTDVPSPAALALL